MYGVAGIASPRSSRAISRAEIAPLGAGCSLTFTGTGDLRPRRYGTYAPLCITGEDEGDHGPKGLRPASGR